jgi:hypothetical protein
MFNSGEKVGLRYVYDWLDASFLSELREINGSISLGLEGSALSQNHYNGEIHPKQKVSFSGDQM